MNQPVREAVSERSKGTAKHDQPILKEDKLRELVSPLEKIRKAQIDTTSRSNKRNKLA